MAQLVLVGRDWTTRALLRAQLLEEGVGVEAYESLEDAHQALVRPLPALLVADLTASNDPEADIRNLAKWVNRVPTWIIASRSSGVAADLEGHGFERIFFRPVDVGELVSLIKQREAEKSTGSRPSEETTEEDTK
jgi:DNA-binding NtrC family response regulator